MLKFMFGLLFIVTLSFLMHLYVFFKLSLFFSIKKGVLFYISVFFTSVLIILTTIFIRRWNNLFTQLFYKLSGFFLGVFFLTFISLLFFEMAKVIYPIPEKTFKIAALSIAIILIFYSSLNARSTSVKTIKIDDFGAELKLVQVSDLHLSSPSPFSKLAKIVEKINSINPEMVVITGDIVSQDTPINNKTFAPLKKLHAKTYFITGNHEYYVGKDMVSKLIEDTGVKTLKDEVNFFNGIQVVGLEYDPNIDRARTILSNLRIDENQPALLLNHFPINPKDKRIRITISGHTHYGQIVPFNFIVRLATKYLKGLYKLETGYLYVSPGTGTWGPPMRLGSKNEITVLDLK